jgi:HEAT repeat protein
MEAIRLSSLKNIQWPNRCAVCGAESPNKTYTLKIDSEALDVPVCEVDHEKWTMAHSNLEKKNRLEMGGSCVVLFVALGLGIASLWIETTRNWHIVMCVIGAPALMGILALPVIGLSKKLYREDALSGPISVGYNEKDKEYVLSFSNAEIARAFQQSAVKGFQRKSQNINELLAAFDDSDLATRYLAYRDLEKINDALAIVPLLDALHKGKWEERENAQTAIAKALANIGNPAITPLINALEEENWQVVAGAAEALGYVKGVYFRVQPLINALGLAIPERLGVDSDVAHYYISSALGNIGQPAIEYLMKAIHDDNFHVSLGAVIALGKYGQWPMSAEPIIAKLKHESWRMRQAAATALGEIHDQRAVDPLITVLLEDEHDLVRCSAAEALGMLRNHRAIQPLSKVEMEGASDLLVRAASSALKAIGSKG